MKTDNIINPEEVIDTKGFDNVTLSSVEDIAFDDRDQKRLETVLAALEHFDVPATPRDVARTVSRSAWGGIVKEDTVDTMLKRLPEVEYIPWGKYILKKNEKRGLTYCFYSCKIVNCIIMDSYTIDENLFR